MGNRPRRAPGTPTYTPIDAPSGRPRQVNLLALTLRGTLHPVSPNNSRPVYSTGRGRLCPSCGWPAQDCHCSSAFARDEAVPAKVVAKLRLEKKGRGGKAVTVVFDLPRNQTLLKDLCAELKRTCGVGGAVAGNTVEIQGDQLARVRPLLAAKGWTVKG
jgi:translation initiation factor 1